MRMIPIACCMFFNSFLRHFPTHVPEGNLVYICGQKVKSVGLERLIDLKRRIVGCTSQLLELVDWRQQVGM